MTDKKGMEARRKRRLRRETELRRINDVYTMEVLEDSHEGKGKEEIKQKRKAITKKPKGKLS